MSQDSFVKVKKIGRYVTTQDTGYCSHYRYSVVAGSMTSFDQLESAPGAYKYNEISFISLSLSFPINFRRNHTWVDILTNNSSDVSSLY